MVIEFARTLTGPLWEASCADADGFLAEQRRLGHCVSTRAGKAGVLSGFYEVVIARYEGRRATGVLVEQPIDEFNRQTGADTANPYLLINRRTAPRLVPVGRNFPWKGIALRPQALREDRILSEIPAKIVADLPTTTDVREPEVRLDIGGTHDANIAA